jgi:hypothetical protein
MPAPTAISTTSSRTVQRTAETWVWRDTSFEGVVSGSTPPAAPAQRGWV